ncbi:MAG TPA: class I SAM-dependent methyltransferase, partial [Acidimicrobiales bacterium]|nr:class I SAM-dependent methyltransferase [Acidimicrobiales bacterium]
ATGPAGATEPDAVLPGVATWTTEDERYRGYRPARRGVRLDHRVKVALGLLPHRPGSWLVDVGAGDGYATSCAGARTGATVAVSVDAGFPAPLAPLEMPVTRVRADVGGRLPFADASFDVVMSLEVIEHLLDPDRLLEEAARLLAPDGVLVLSTPRLDGLLVVANLLAGLQPPGVDASARHRYGNTLGEGRPSGHLHLFTRKALLEALAHHGFEVEAYQEGRFSSSWRQARAGRPWGVRDLALTAFFAAYDLIPARKDVLVVRARRRRAAPAGGTESR